MRVISGKVKGSRLIAPNNMNVRPTTDRIKEAIFSSIQGYIEGSTVLDLFAGTGSLGIEALSRGASKVYFADNSKDSIAIINENLMKTKLEQQSEVLFMDAKLAMNKIAREGVELDVVFLDPPYGKDILESIMTELIDSKLVKNDTIIITEHEKDISLKDKMKSFYKFKEKKYGKIIISFFKSEEADWSGKSNIPW